jgi:hypothetical protein
VKQTRSRRALVALLLCSTLQALERLYGWTAQRCLDEGDPAQE